MKKEIIYSLKGIYREDYQIEGYRFGGGEKSAWEHRNVILLQRL